MDLAIALGTVAELPGTREVRVGISTGARAIQGPLANYPARETAVREAIAIPAARPFLRDGTLDRTAEELERLRRAAGNTAPLHKISKLDTAAGSRSSGAPHESGNTEDSAMTLETPPSAASGVAPEPDTGAGGGISLGPTAAQEDLRIRMARFVAEVLRPREHELLLRHGDLPWEVVQELRARAREYGVYAPHLPAEYGGLGLDWRSVAIAFEEAGSSLLGPMAINGAAPDEGNLHLLEVIARPDQKERYLRPLAEGRTRSCFAMTEPPPGAGADPNLLRTRATRLPGGGWSINGHKWFITGARGAAFAIVMARTSDDPDPRRGATMFLVDAGTPGFEVVRDMPTLDHAAFYAGHAEVHLEDCRVPDEAILGEADLGFEYAQVRLVPARLTHCMRWLGLARRAHEIAAQYATSRTSFGQPLGEHQMVQAMLADSAIDLHAARLLVWDAAWKLDLGRPAREESSMAKVFVAEAVNRIVDRSVQVCGGLGTTDDLLLGLFYREVRAFRIYDGPSEVHRAAIARRVLRKARSQAASAAHP